MKLPSVALLACLLMIPVLSLGTACNGGGGGETTNGAQPLLAELGAPTFQSHCAACHGIDGRGDGPAAGALRKAPADLTRIAARRGGVFPEAEIATYIDGRFELDAHGTREMPIWGEQLGEEIAPGVDPDEVARGRILTLIEYLESIQRTD